jgi:hypothetical protein
VIERKWLRGRIVMKTDLEWNEGVVGVIRVERVRGGVVGVDWE